MKKFLIALALLVSSFTLPPAQAVNRDHDPYAFVQEFQLVSATIQGKYAYLTLRHTPAPNGARFEFIPVPYCAESYPELCSGTIVRLDYGDGGEECTEITDLRIDLEKIYGDRRRIELTFTAPNKEITALYRGSKSPDVN